MKKFFILSTLIISALSGCSTTFDKQGNFTDRATQLDNPDVSQLSDERAVFIHERSLQLWRPKDPEQGHKTTLVSQGALISHDGYTLAAGHAFNDSQVFTFHSRDAKNQLLRVNHWDTNGIHHINLDGTETVFKEAQFIPIRMVHRFEDIDLALIQAPVRNSKFFDLAPSPPEEGSSLSYCYNPIIHRDLRGLTGIVTDIETRKSSSWKIKGSGAAIFGDSGGAVTDQSGQLVGSITGARIGIFSLGKAKRVLDVDLERVSPQLIEQIIEKDRESMN